MCTETWQYKKYDEHLSVKDVSDSKGESKVPAIKQIEFSVDGKFFATSDESDAVSLFRRKDTGEWTFHAKIRSHRIEITSICFGYDYDENEQLKHRLFSVGRDRRCFEYAVNLNDPSAMSNNVEVFLVEQEAQPTACIWYPKLDIKEPLLLTANNEYKMKLWNPGTLNSRRTCLGPTYGGEICKLKHLTFPDKADRYLIYATRSKVIGLIQLPLDGNPNNTMGLIAHPDEITDVCCSADGRYIFSCGGDDLAVNMWEVDVTPIKEAIALGGEGIEPFIKLIEGGREGQTFQDMNDFFYYSMIRSKKENTTKTRKLDGNVPVDELANLMRAMGYYPTDQEVANMNSEVRFSVMAETGTPTTHIKLTDFIRLFVNHRPVYGIGKNNIEDAFRALTEKGQDKEGPPGTISKAELLNLLQTDGEEISKTDMDKFL